MITDLSRPFPRCEKDLTLPADAAEGVPRSGARVYWSRVFLVLLKDQGFLALFHVF